MAGGVNDKGNSYYLVPIIRHVEGWETSYVQVEADSREEATEILATMDVNRVIEEDTLHGVSERITDVTLPWEINVGELLQMVLLDHKG